jgi:hypothetical protein
MTMEKAHPGPQALTTKGVLVAEDTLAVAAALVVVEDTVDLAGSAGPGATAVRIMEVLTMDLMVTTKDIVTDPLMDLLVDPGASVVAEDGAHGDVEASLEAAAAASTHPPLQLISGINSTRAFLPLQTTKPPTTTKITLPTPMSSTLSPPSSYTSRFPARRRRMLASTGMQTSPNSPSLESYTALVTRSF